MLGLVMMRGEHWSEAVEEFEAALRKPGVPLERQAMLETFRANALANIPEW
jgi:outer membrane protein assembly factor BamD (BamD/ComL family)